MEAILQASTLLLERDGIEALNTNAVARVAGVSVGSLYQYFPDKHAIVAELARGLEKRGLELASERVGAVAQADARSATWALVGILLDPALGSLAVRRALLCEVPRSWIREATGHTDGGVEQLLSGFVASRPREFRDADPDIVAFVAYHAVEGVIESALVTGIEVLDRPWFREELFHLAWRYAAADGASRAVPPEARSVSEERTTLRASTPASASILERLAEERSHRLETSPRDGASTARGRETAERILDAASRILVDEGLDAMSVRRVADEAGLSAGALYRHFRNKQAVIAELARRLEGRKRALLADRLQMIDKADVSGVIAALVRLVATSDLGDPRLRQALLSEVPRRWIEDAAMRTHGATVAGVAAQMRARSDAVRDVDPERLAFVAYRAVLSVVEAALTRHPEWITEGRLVDECVALVDRYVRA